METLWEMPKESWRPSEESVEVSATRGTTALVYCLINSSLYTGTVQRWWNTPSWLDGHQGYSQLSTRVKIVFETLWEITNSLLGPLYTFLWGPSHVILTV
jgi:hypothetical protein